MSLSMHQAAVPPLVRQLNALTAILMKAEAFAEAKKIDPAVLLNGRLAPDMHPLTRQIQLASDGAKGGLARLAGQEPPSFPDVEATIPELLERITKTIAFIAGLPVALIDGTEEKTITMKVGPAEMQFPGQFYLLSFIIPNFYFHVTTAYAILRFNGVEIGKRDFLGA